MPLFHQVVGFAADYAVIGAVRPVVSRSMEFVVVAGYSPAPLSFRQKFSVHVAA